MSDESCAPAPDPDAGQDGNGEQQLTEEERMLKEIAELKELIDALQTRDMRGMAPHRKKLGQLEFKYHLSVEKKRLARAMSKFEEMHGALYSEPCLVCLDDFHVHASESLTEEFGCCGGFICKTCLRDIKESGMGLSKCPLCRESIDNTTEAEAAAKLMALAERGVVWAQADVGRRMMYGNAMFKKQGKTGLEWLNKAAAQNDPAALFSLATLGMASVLRKSDEEAKELMMKSANLGYALANSWLAKVYLSGQNGFEKDTDEGYFRASVTFALDDAIHEAAKLLGGCHFYQDISEPSPFLACYYLNIAASEDENGIVSCSYSGALSELSQHLHDGNIAIPGFNVVPTVLFWIRKSCDLGFNDAREQLKMWESYGQSNCAHCKKKAQTGEKFKQCSKCKAEWYCSKGCQVEAWRAGHKNDCKRAAILNFDDYINAE